MTKIRNIEFLRVFLISSIVILHMFIDRRWCLCTLFPDISLYQNISRAICHSNNCVEGFFMVAGFLLVLTYKPENTIKDFVIKKYIRFSPVILFSMVLCFIGFLLGAMDFNWVANILTVLLLNQFGAKFVVGQNPILWYTSVLFASLFLYFCILKVLSGRKRNLLIFTLIVLSYTILEILQHGSFSNPLKNYCHHILNIGFLRGVGGVGIGCLIGFLYKNVLLTEKIKFKGRFLKIILTVFEAISMSFVFWWCLIIHKGINNIFFVFAFAVLLILFVFKKGYFSEILDKDIWVKLGKYQYSIYVVHYVIIRIFGLALWKEQSEFVTLHPFMPILIMFAAILVVGVLTYYMVELPCANFLKQRLLGK